MRRVYKAHKGDMLEKNTLLPIPCMQPKKGLYNRHTGQVNHSLIF